MATITDFVDNESLTPFTYDHFIKAVHTFKDDMFMCYIDRAVGIYCNLRGISVGTRPEDPKEYSQTYQDAFEAANYAIYIVSTKIGSFNPQKGDFKPYLDRALSNALKDIIKADGKGDFFDQTSKKADKEDEPEKHDKVDIDRFRGDTDSSDPDNISENRDERIRKHKNDALEVMIEYIDSLSDMNRAAIYASAFGRMLRPDLEDYGRNYAEIIAGMYNTTALYVRQMATRGKKEALAEARRLGFDEQSMARVSMEFIQVKNNTGGMFDRVLDASRQLEPHQQFMLLLHLARKTEERKTDR